MELNIFPAQRIHKQQKRDSYKTVISTRFAEGYKRKPDETKRSESEPVSEIVNWSAARIN
jgi:hypothetical protein